MGGLVTDFADWNEPAANAVAIGNTNLTGTGLAKESGGNLDTHTKLLGGTQAGALIANTGLTVGQEMAALIATGSATGTAGGAPLLHGARRLFTVGSQVVAASGTFSTGNITFTRPGYLIRVTCQMSAAGAVQPTVKADMSWTVAASGSPITAQEQWYLPAGSVTAMRTNGKGPTKGDTLNITFTNGDATDTVTLFVDVWETTQHVARDDWRSTGSVASAGGGAIGNQNQAGLIATDSFSVPASSSVTKNLPLYCGQAAVFVNQNSAAGSQISFNPGSIFSAAFLATFVVIDWTVSAHIVTLVNLPRGYCQLIATNNAASAQVCAVSIIPVEFAS